MTEYPQHEVSEGEIKRQSNPLPEGYLAGSVIVGAILIAASIFYNAKLILKKLDTGLVAGTSVTAQNQPPLPGVQPSAQPQANAQNNAGAMVAVPAREDVPVLGKDNAKVTFVEFGDFQCSYCQRFIDDTFGQLKSKYIDTGKMKVIYRYFPLPFHVNAQKAAEAAECAYQQGKFWEYHDLLYKDGQGDGTGLAAADLKKYAGNLGLNTDSFNACLDSGAAAAVVAQDVKDGQAAGVNGTPTFFVNGKQIVGAQPTATFDQAIEAELKK
jgi:protein-disulfide isomerase